MTQNDAICYQTSTSWKPTVITQKHFIPHSYDLVTASGNVIRRNRHHLISTQEARLIITLPVDDDDTDISLNTSSSTSSRPAQPTLTADPNTCQVIEKRTRSGRLVRSPSWYGDN